jgi:dephospho-CoA kinase
MTRILVTGNAGSGKSTLARRIAGQLDLPYHSLDRVVWQPGWKKTPKEERERQVQELTSQEQWVIDGVSFAAQDAADTVIFLDVPRRTCFWRVIKRNWRFAFRSRPELPPGCPEILIVPTLCRIIWNFPLTVRPGILERMSAPRNPKQCFHIRTKSGDASLRERLAARRVL